MSDPRSSRIITPLPGPESQRLMALRKEAVARGPFHTTPLFIRKAEGAVLEDVDGNRFLDFTCGIGVTNVGHCPPSVVAAVKQQAGHFLHTSFNVAPYELYVQVCEALNRATPGAFPKKSLLVNSGAEAVENAIKFARAFTRRPAVVCFEHAYHGRTYLAMTLTSKAKPYKFGFAPFNSDVYRAPYPYAYRWPTTEEKDQVARECFARFEELVATQIGPESVAAVILEPVLGEGGFVPAPPAFLKKLREYCTANGIVLIADEVQTGFGRTGTLFASEGLGFEPDLMVTAKGLASGLPLAAVTGRAEIMDSPGEGGVGGTYGGNPLACAASLEVFKAFADGSLLARARALGSRLADALKKLQAKHPNIGDVRGLGPMQAVEWVTDRATKKPDKDLTGRIVREAWNRGLVLLSAGTHGNVIRFLVPLVITDAELDEGLGLLEEAIQAATLKP
jgi:4-aminobutyrate aminotransferase/(S)-3-amino-2-methylpropionate transaminase